MHARLDCVPRGNGDFITPVQPNVSCNFELPLQDQTTRTLKRLINVITDVQQRDPGNLAL